MAVDNQFERLEGEVDRLVQLLGHLKQENTNLQNRLQDLEAEHDSLQETNTHLEQIAQTHQETLKTNDEVKGRLENLLGKLDQVQL